MKRIEIEELLENALNECEKLKNLKFEIVIAKNGNETKISLEFPIRCFYHLLGFQYLVDINHLHSDTNKERLYLDVLDNKNSLKCKIVESKYILDIVPRLIAVTKLITILDSNEETYYSKSSYFIKWRRIEYDYAFHFQEDDIWYDFYFIKDNGKDSYSMISLFSDQKPLNCHANRPHTLIKKTKYFKDTDLTEQLYIK